MNERMIFFYFSGTGNTLAVARELAKKLDSSSDKTPESNPGNESRLKLISMPAALEKKETRGEKITGLFFPVYMWGLPLIVKRFFEHLEVPSNSYVFAVTTYGGFPAATLLMAQDLLARRGIPLHTGFGVQMPGNYIPFYGAWSEEKQKKTFEAASRKIERIASEIRNQTSSPVETNSPPINWFFSRIIYSLGSTRIPTSDSRFWTNEKCSSCGICVRVCPVGNVTMDGNRPKWHGRCEHCLACLQWCPEQAIEYGRFTKKRKRYHHPSIKVSELFQR